ncbi:MAG: hypothetical protein ACOCVF_00220 [bacterium]
MAKKSSLAGLAKKGSRKKASSNNKTPKNKSTTTTTKNKAKESTKVEEKQTDDPQKKDQQEIDPKSTEIQSKVSKLIEHVDLIKNNVGKAQEQKKDDEDSEVLSMESTSDAVKVTDKKDAAIIWYEEQLNEMYAKYDQLKKEKDKIAEEATIGFSGANSSEDKKIKEGILVLFNELQGHYMKLGENLIIHPKQFIERLIKFFPFLEQHRKF